MTIRLQAPLRKYFNTNNFPDFANKRIYCILEDYQENIWIGTGNGLFKLIKLKHAINNTSKVL